MGKGWLGAPLIKKRLRKVQKIEARNVREPCCVGSRGLFKGPGGLPLVRVQGAKPPETPLHFNADRPTAFPTQTYICHSDRVAWVDNVQGLRS